MRLFEQAVCFSDLPIVRMPVPYVRNSVLCFGSVSVVDNRVVLAPEILIKVSSSSLKSYERFFTLYYFDSPIEPDVLALAYPVHIVCQLFDILVVRAHAIAYESERQWVFLENIYSAVGIRLCDKFCRVEACRTSSHNLIQSVFLFS